MAAANVLTITAHYIFRVYKKLPTQI